MLSQEMLDIERKVARCRILLSLFAMAALFVEPMTPAVIRGLGVTSATTYQIDEYARVVLGAHLGYSLAVLLSLQIGLVPRGIVGITTWADVLFGTAIALLTEGTASPFYVFFAFAIIAAGVRGGFRFSVTVTALSIWLYMTVIVIAASREPELQTVILRPAYLAIVGYLVAYLGRLRLGLDAKLAGLERAKERGEIARSLHDGCVQTLAGTNLTLGSCQELVKLGRADEAVTVLAELQSSITREYDGLRTYIRELADHDTAPPTELEFDTRFAVNAQFAGPGPLVEHVLQILLEGVRNVRRHAFARSASVEAFTVGPEIKIRLDDDGLGFGDESRAPWSISSRVDQLGGQLEVTRDKRAGAHLAIALRTG
jgi:signal transduction histidine kinase